MKELVSSEIIPYSRHPAREIPRCQIPAHFPYHLYFALLQLYAVGPRISNNLKKGGH